MRQLACLCAAVALVGATALPAGASVGAVEASARASIVAGIIDAQPAFDPAIVDSRSTLSTIGTSTTASVVWPSFLVDAFFYLYGFQSVERVGLGIAESRWPSGPTAADATLSDLAFANGGDAMLVPGKGGRSIARAASDVTSGQSSITDAALPGGIAVDAATSTSQIEGAISAEQTVSGVRVGPLSIDAIRGTTSIVGQDARARLVIAGATVAGVPVTIDDEGAHATTATAQAIVDDALTGRGLDVRVIPTRTTDGQNASASTGGLAILASQQATDPTGTPRDVRVGVTLGVATAARGVTIIPAVILPPSGGGGPFADLIGPPPSLSDPPVDVPRADARGLPIVRTRQIVTPVPTTPAGAARTAYGALLLIAAGALLFRPLVRAVARP